VTDGTPTVTDVVLAIDFGGTKTAVGCATADGELRLAHRMATYPSPAERSAARLLERVLAEADRLRRQAAAEPGWRLAGAGAVFPGVVRPDGVLLAPNMPGWESLSVTRMVEAGLPGLTVSTGNDVRAAALAEARWGRLRGVANGLYVNVGTGLSAAIVLDGRPVAGAHGAAGEIGYAVSVGTDGHRILEEVIGGGPLGEQASQIAGRPMTAADAFAASEPRLRRLVDDAVADFGRQLASFATLLDPERIVIGGGLMNDAERLLGPLRAALATIAPFQAEIVPSEFTDPGLLGAAALAFDTAGLASGAAGDRLCPAT
jgi:glucokinase